MGHRVSRGFLFLSGTRLIHHSQCSAFQDFPANHPLAARIALRNIGSRRRSGLRRAVALIRGRSRRRRRGCLEVFARWRWCRGDRGLCTGESWIQGMDKTVATMSGDIMFPSFRKDGDSDCPPQSGAPRMAPVTTTAYSLA